MKFFFVVMPLLLLAVAELVVIFMARSRMINLPLKPLSILALASLIMATIITLYLFDQLVTPLRLAKQSLEDYLSNREIPGLPVGYKDEAGNLLSNIQTTITQLDTLISEKSDMIDLLSHDLRSPVGRILSLSNLIKTDDESNKELYADYIINECKGLLRMLENILLMLKEDNKSFLVANVNLKMLMMDTVSFFDFAAAEKKLKFQVEIDDSIHVNVQPDLFVQAVRNIIGNAVKFSPEGKSITITGLQDEEKVSLTIQDKGLGFQPVDIQRIFDRFTTAGKKGTRGETSTGLGLYLSKKIVEKHGGKLLAESEGIGQGASFTIVLYRLITKKNKGKSLFSNQESNAAKTNTDVIGNTPVQEHLTESKMVLEN